MTETVFKFPPSNVLSLTRFYGKPWELDSREKLVLDRSWEAANITRVRVPFALFMEGARILNISVHKRLVDSVKEVLNEIFSEFTNQEREVFGLDQYGGGYQFRPNEYKAENLSLHAYGAALDFSPILNPMGKAYKSADKMIPMKFINIFTKHGWKWGGSFKPIPECAHFEATS